MSRLYEWLIGTRYLRSTHRRGFVSFVALMSVIGLMLGVAVLIVVLSVMNGFERQLRIRILSVTSHATLMGLDGTLAHWQHDRAVARRLPGVIATAPYIEEHAMLVHGRNVRGSVIRGVLPADARATTGLAQHMTSGRLDDLVPGRYRIILGSALAQELGVKRGDSVVLLAPEGTATPGGIMPRMRRFHVSGIFHAGMYQFDSGLALVQLSDAARVYRLGGKVTGIRLRVHDPFRAPAIVHDLALALGGGFYVSDWTREHENFFRSIELDKSMMFIILSMIVAVAAFNVVATLVMIVKEKRSDIAILRTLGAAPRNILALFGVQGVLIGLAGTAAGAALGVGLSRHLESLVHDLERLLHTQFLNASVYYMSDLPAYVEWHDVLKVCGVAFALCALATVYPAWRAARTAPAEALRHD